MNREEFEELVRKALTEMPEKIRTRLDNVDILVEDWSTMDQMTGSGIEDRHHLLALYEGIPLTERYGYEMVLPDKITLFQKPIEAVCASDKDIVEEVRATIVHELAHHFGINDNRLERFGI